MPGSNSEKWGRFCDGLGSNIMVQYSVGPIITLHGRIYVDGSGNQVQVHPMNQKLFPNNDAKIQFSKTTISPLTRLELLSHGLKSMKVNFNIFPGQHSHQI
jgi:hypothetical protein